MSGEVLGQYHRLRLRGEEITSALALHIQITQMHDPAPT